MNAIFAMAHYCEAHGPRVIFVTQAFHQPSNFTKKSFYGDPRRLRTKEPGRWDWKVCPACTSLPSFVGVLVTNDHPGFTSYVSSNHGLDEALYKRLNHACLRVTSCEVADFVRRQDGVGGPLIFGDVRLLGGSVLAFVFTLKDSASRGVKRTYSIFVIMPDKQWLFDISHDLLDDFKVLASDLQIRAFKTFQNEGESTAGVRDLSELCRDPHLYYRLHRQFVQYFVRFGKSFRETLFLGTALEEERIVRSCNLTFNDIFGALKKCSVDKLVYYLVSRKPLTVEASSRDLLKEIIWRLEYLTPSPVSAIPEEKDGRYLVRIGTGPSESRLYIDEKDGKYEIRLEDSWCCPSPLPRLAARIGKIVSKPGIPDEITQANLQFVREEYFGFAKIWHVGRLQNKDTKNVISKMNLNENDQELLVIWAKNLNPSFLESLEPS